ALITFPLVVERWMPSRQQALVWSGAYVVFAILCALLAWASRREAVAAGLGPPPAQPGPGGSVARPSAWEMLLWVALATCASTLLVAVTNHMSQDIAAIPLL